MEHAMGVQYRPYPIFSWSESRDRRFRECRRKHFFAVYLSHNGWLPDAPAARRLAWTLGKAVPSWYVALGSALHRQMLACARQCADTGVLPLKPTVRDSVRRSRISHCATNLEYQRVTRMSDGEIVAILTTPLLGQQRLKRHLRHLGQKHPVSYRKSGMQGVPKT